MKWRVEWSYPALAALRAIPWRQAARVDAAVQRLAEHNEGELCRGVLCVWYVYRR